MDSYTNILLATDLFDKHQSVADRAKDIAERYQARLSIIHVVDILPVTDPAYEVMLPFDMDLATEFIAAAKTKLAQLGKQLAIAETDLRLEVGSPKQEIIRVAEEIKADLIIIGSHGRHGLALLLGSTANGVLHHATCDVLAVRLQNN